MTPAEGDGPTRRRRRFERDRSIVEIARKARRHPWTAVRRAKAALTRPLLRPPKNPIAHFDRDWDNLVLLDACRYDVFEACSTIGGRLRSVESDSSHTTGFLSNNLDRSHPETVYVTASPQLVGYEDRLHDVVHVWDDRWDDATDTVLPEDVAAVAARAAANYPNKRLVVHFMQPHYPFLGPTAAEIGDVASFSGGAEAREKPSVWDLLTAGRISADLVWEAYRETLELALPHVRTLLDELSGKTVISSDHGNLFWKRVSFLPLRVSGHPMDYPDEELVTVPWLEVPFQERRQITAAETSAEPSVESSVETRQNSGDAEERLSDLGYRS